MPYAEPVAGWLAGRVATVRRCMLTGAETYEVHGTGYVTIGGAGVVRQLDNINETRN